ncbi:hypothetical protein IC582_028183 [Cucumis melo]
MALGTPFIQLPQLLPLQPFELLEPSHPLFTSGVKWKCQFIKLTKVTKHLIEEV